MNGMCLDLEQEKRHYLLMLVRESLAILEKENISLEKTLDILSKDWKFHKKKDLEEYKKLISGR